VKLFFKIFIKVYYLKHRILKKISVKNLFEKKALKKKKHRPLIQEITVSRKNMMI
jgi:hypothetical protein